MSIETYTQPVAALLTYGDCLKMDFKHWDDYPTKVGLTGSDIPELIRMATDPEFWNLDGDRLELWAPVHAWRALGQLKAEAAIAPLLNLLEERDNEWVTEEMPLVYALIGPAALPALAAYLADDSHETWSRITAATCLKGIAEAYPDQQDACIALLIQQLEQFEENPCELNSFITSDLIDLNVVKAAPLIEQVYAAGQIDEFVVGTWANTQVDLGLKRREDFSADELKPKIPRALAQLAEIGELLRASQDPPSKGFGTAPKGKSKTGKKKKGGKR